MSKRTIKNTRHPIKKWFYPIYDGITSLVITLIFIATFGIILSYKSYTKEEISCKYLSSCLVCSICLVFLFLNIKLNIKKLNVDKINLYYVTYICNVIIPSLFIGCMYLLIDYYDILYFINSESFISFPSFWFILTCAFMSCIWSNYQANYKNTSIVLLENIEHFVSAINLSLNAFIIFLGLLLGHSFAKPIYIILLFTMLSHTSAQKKIGDNLNALRSQQILHYIQYCMRKQKSNYSKLIHLKMRQTMRYMQNCKKS